MILVIQYAAHLRTQPGYLLLTSLATADFAVSLFVTTTKTHMYAHNGSFCLRFGKLLQYFTVVYFYKGPRVNVNLVRIFYFPQPKISGEIIISLLLFFTAFSAQTPAYLS